LLEEFKTGHGQIKKVKNVLLPKLLPNKNISQKADVTVHQEQDLSQNGKATDFS
jgi:hypothetical protein